MSARFERKNEIGDLKLQFMENVFKTNVYGVAPHTVYTVLYDWHDGLPASSVDVSTPSLDALSEALKDGLIPIGEVEMVVGNMEKLSGSTFSDAEKLSFAKKMAKGAIDGYDASDAVNGFTLRNGTSEIEYWLPAATRNQLVTSVTTWSDNHDDYTLDLRDYGMSLRIPCNTLLEMLAELEKYAVECFNVTSSHWNAVFAMKSVADVVAFDYTAGYPDKLVFDL